MTFIHPTGGLFHFVHVLIDFRREIRRSHGLYNI